MWVNFMHHVVCHQCHVAHSCATSVKLPTDVQCQAAYRCAIHRSFVLLAVWGLVEAAQEAGLLLCAQQPHVNCYVWRSVMLVGDHGEWEVVCEPCTPSIPLRGLDSLTRWTILSNSIIAPKPSANSLWYPAGCLKAKSANCGLCAKLDLNLQSRQHYVLFTLSDSAVWHHLYE